MLSYLQNVYIFFHGSWIATKCLYIFGGGLLPVRDMSCLHLSSCDLLAL